MTIGREKDMIGFTSGIVRNAGASEVTFDASISGLTLGQAVTLQSLAANFVANLEAMEDHARRLAPQTLGLDPSAESHWRVSGGALG